MPSWCVTRWLVSQCTPIWGSWKDRINFDRKWREIFCNLVLKLRFSGLILKLNGWHKAIKLGRINFLDSLELVSHLTRPEMTVRWFVFHQKEISGATSATLFTLTKPEVLLPVLTFGRLLLYNLLLHRISQDAISLRHTMETKLWREF